MTIKIWTAPDFFVHVRGAVMFCKLAKPRAGVAEIPSDGEELSVTT